MRKPVLLALLLELFALTVGGAVVCSPPPLQVRVLCDGWDPGFLIYNFRNPERAQEELVRIEDICRQSLADIKPVFSERVGRWTAEEPPYVAKGGPTLIFEPYSPTRELVLLAGARAYGSCAYQRYERIGSWLVVSEQVRSYCYDNNRLVSCYSAPDTFSHSLFVWFLLNNVSISTLPYLIPYLLGTLVFVAFLVHLARRWALLHWLKPGVLRVILTVGVSLLLICSGRWLDIPLWTGVAYLSASILNYVLNWP